SSRTVQSVDPNDKLAPAGYGDAAYIQADGSLAYSVMFENKADATAPAQHISVTDVLDSNLDLDTFQLTDINLANISLPVPAGLSHYEATVPMTVNGTGILVYVTADLDKSTRKLTFTLSAVDPLTGWYPEDPLIGLLYPENGSGRGQG